MIIWFSLARMSAMKESIFIFTDQKIMAKYNNVIYLIPYINITSISSIDEKTHYEIKILLRNGFASSPFRDKFSIYIPHIPNNSDLVEKIKQLRKDAMSKDI
jgi:hypothetical protein